MEPTKLPMWGVTFMYGQADVTKTFPSFTAPPIFPYGSLTNYRFDYLNKMEKYGEVVGCCAFSSAFHVTCGLRAERNIVAAMMIVQTIKSTA